MWGAIATQHYALAKPPPSGGGKPTATLNQNQHIRRRSTSFVCRFRYRPSLQCYRRKYRRAAESGGILLHVGNMRCSAFHASRCSVSAARNIDPVACLRTPSRLPRFPLLACLGGGPGYPDRTAPYQTGGAGEGRRFEQRNPTKFHRSDIRVAFAVGQLPCPDAVAKAVRAFPSKSHRLAVYPF